MGTEANFCQTGEERLQVLQGWMGIEVKDRWDGYNICRDRWGIDVVSVLCIVQASTQQLKHMHPYTNTTTWSEQRLKVG